jgi:hypothetical protein
MGNRRCGKGRLAYMGVLSLEISQEFLFQFYDLVVAASSMREMQV